MRALLLPFLVTLPLLTTARSTTATPHNVLLARGRTEPAVAVDAAHPSFIVASANTNYASPVNGTFPVAYFTSHDGGKSFTAGTVPVRWPFTTAADTSVAISSNGTVFYSYLGETPSYCGGGGGAIALSISRDGGRTFGTPLLVDSNPNDDRPTLALEDIRGHAPHVFLAWDRSLPTYSEVWYARSLDGGRTFSRPSMLYWSKSNNFGVRPVVGSHQHIYLFWPSYAMVGSSVAGPAHVLLRVSRDDGAHFTNVQNATRSFANLPALTQPGSLRTVPAEAEAASQSGTLYIAYAAVSSRHRDGSVDADIWLSQSVDGGHSWSRPNRVNDVRRGDRFMPTMSVLQDGSLGLAYYDRRSHPWELDVYAARASFKHGFHVSRNVRVNSTYSSTADIYYLAPGQSCFPEGRFFGDYIGSAAQKNTLAVVWADTQLHQRDETDIWFSGVRLPSVP